MLRRPFKAVTKAYGPAYADSEAQTRSVQEGDRVLLSSAVLDAINSELKGDNMPYPIIFKVTNNSLKGLDVSTHVGVLEFSTERGMAIFPPQVMKTLSVIDGDSVSLRLVSLPTAGKAVFKPLTPEFANLDDPQAVLQSAFRIFTTLTQGTIISLLIDGKHYDLLVQELYAASGRAKVPAVCLIDSELTVEFVGMQESKDNSVTDLTAGTLTKASLDTDECHYYRVKLDHPELGIEINCQPTTLSKESQAGASSNSMPNRSAASPTRAALGDPDLFVSTQTLKPSELKCEWSDQVLGESQIAIFPDDPKYSKTWYYICVKAYKKPCDYTLFVGAPRITKDEYIARKGKGRKTGGQLIRQTSSEKVELSDDPNMELCTNCNEYFQKGMQFRIHATRCAQQTWRCIFAGCGKLIDRKDKDHHIHCEKCPLVASSHEELEKHMDIVHTLRTCLACGSKLLLSDMNGHLENECVKRLVPCTYCDVKKPLVELEEHEIVCGSRTVNCKICSKLVVLRKMNIHLAAEHGINPSMMDTSSYADEFKANRDTSGILDAATARMDEDEKLARALAASLNIRSSSSSSYSSDNPFSTQVQNEQNSYGFKDSAGDAEDAILKSVIEASLRENQQHASATTSTDPWDDLPHEDDNADQLSFGSWGDE